MFDEVEFIFEINQFQEERKKVEVKKLIKFNNVNVNGEALIERIGK